MDVQQHDQQLRWRVRESAVKVNGRQTRRPGPALQVWKSLVSPFGGIGRRDTTRKSARSTDGGCRFSVSGQALRNGITVDAQIAPWLEFARDLFLQNDTRDQDFRNLIKPILCHRAGSMYKCVYHIRDRATHLSQSRARRKAYKKLLSFSSPIDIYHPFSTQPPT